MTTLTFAESFAIVEGPGKFELMESLFVRDARVTFTIESKLGSKEPFKAHIYKIGQGDNNCTAWQIYGSLSHVNYPNQYTDVHGYYSSTTRTGWIKFKEPGTGAVHDVLAGRRIRLGNPEPRIKLGTPAE